MPPPHVAGGGILKQVPSHIVHYAPPVGGEFFLPGPLGGGLFTHSLLWGGDSETLPKSVVTKSTLPIIKAKKSTGGKNC